MIMAFGGVCVDGVIRRALWRPGGLCRGLAGQRWTGRKNVNFFVDSGVRESESAGGIRTGAWGDRERVGRRRCFTSCWRAGGNISCFFRCWRAGVGRRVASGRGVRGSGKGWVIKLSGELVKDGKVLELRGETLECGKAGELLLSLF